MKVNQKNHIIWIKTIMFSVHRFRVGILLIHIVFSFSTLKYKKNQCKYIHNGVGSEAVSNSKMSLCKAVNDCKF